MQLTKVYLIHERADKEDATAGAAQKILRSQGVGQRVRVKPLALVGDHKDQIAPVVLKADGDLAGWIVFVAVQHGVDDRLADGHGDVEAGIFVKPGVCGQLACRSLHFVNALHGGGETKTLPFCLRVTHRVYGFTSALEWPGKACPQRHKSSAGSFHRGWVVCQARGIFRADFHCRQRARWQGQNGQFVHLAGQQTHEEAAFKPGTCSSAILLERGDGKCTAELHCPRETERMKKRATARVSLTALLGTPVTDAEGHLRGRLKDIAVATGPDAGKVAGLVLKTRAGLWLVPSQEVMETPAGTLELRSKDAMEPLNDQGNYLYLQQDLIDRQIIDLHGRKVVRVNDVDLEWMGQGAVHLLRVAEVEVGLRGAFRRIFKGVMPRATLERISRRFKPSSIPWQFVDVIEVDPARRVKLRIAYERLAEIHPSELADILEDLAPAEREAVFTSLDEDVAADALEEVEPRLQKALLEKLDEEKIADIVEEMDPGAAADLLAELPEEQSDAILEEMEPEERQEVEDLLEFDEDSAAGCMTTDFVQVGIDATVSHAVVALRGFDGDPESVTEIYLLDSKRVLRGVVPLARLVVAQPETRLSVLAETRVLYCSADLHQKDLAEMFDKYNLHALAVLDAQSHMVGVVQADQVIGYLREKL